MKTVCAVIAASFLLAVPKHLEAAGGQLKITIRSGSLHAPIEIQDAELMKEFFFGAGPGNFIGAGASRQPYFKPQSFIVDWSTGIVTDDPSKGSEVYDIEFLSTRTTDKNTYRVSYVYDSARKAGFVYIPGQGDTRYAENTWLLLRGVEGNWFHSWSKWDELVAPLLAKARAN
jgi:hypothetical protein